MGARILSKNGFSKAAFNVGVVALLLTPGLGDAAIGIPKPKPALAELERGQPAETIPQNKEAAPVPAPKPAFIPGGVPVPQRHPDTATSASAQGLVNAGEPALPVDTTPLTPTQTAAYKAALRAAQSGLWLQTSRLARVASDPLSQRYFQWIEASRGHATLPFDEIEAFRRNYPDWPSQSALQRNAELHLPAAWGDAAVLDWFRGNPPVTAEGHDRYMALLSQAGETELLRQHARVRWIEGPVPVSEQTAYLQAFGIFIRDRDHRERLDRLIWERQYDAAQAMLRLVDADTERLAVARLRLAQAEPGVDAAIDRVPSNLKGDPGLVFERTRWRRLRDRFGDAADLLIDVSAANTPTATPTSATTPATAALTRERYIVARHLLARGEYRLAYEVARRHGAESGIDFAQTEWLAGWLALRFLDREEAALTHFERLYAGVTTPISLARAAYWAGAAAQAMGHHDEARAWFRRGAEHPLAFYGQMSASALRAPDRPTLLLPADLRATRAQQIAFRDSDFVQLVVRLNQLGPVAEDHLETFFATLRRFADSPEQFTMIADLAMALGRPAEAVETSRAAWRAGHVLIEAGYPMLEFPVPSTLEPALVHAVIRQESSFDVNARSRVGALGLMQLMPATARSVARKAGLNHQREWLTAQPVHNVTLGMLYLDELVRQYDGSYVLAIAAYNAGPGNVNRWIREIGDPRTAEIEVLDWMERIPFAETRSYIQRVLEATQVYRARFSDGATSLRLIDDLKR